VADSANRSDSQAPAAVGRGARLDGLDIAILSALQEDGRRPYRGLARELGVPEATVRFRARRLEETGVLRVLGFVDPHVLGRGVSAAILVSIQASKHRAVVDEIVTWPEVMYASSCNGRTSLMMHVMCEDDGALLELMTNRLSALDGIQRTETLIELEVHKARYVFPGLRNQQ
jgi:Lrp/AsnC family transcriptional regulator, regulator for asnA, asnC and gidA